MGAKIFFHEASAHVPMVLRLPKSWSARHHGETCPALATLADLLPTLVTAAGGTPPPGVEGLDLLAVARGQAAPREYLEGMSGLCGECDYLAITDGRWKYIYYPEGACEQLFDLETDPQELADLARRPEHDAQRRSLRAEHYGVRFWKKYFDPKRRTLEEQKRKR